MGLEGVLELQKFARGGRRDHHAGNGEHVPGGVRPDAQRQRIAAVGHVLRAGPDRRGGDPQAEAPDLLRLHGEDDAGALCERAAAAGAGSGSRPSGADALHRRRRRGDERLDARRERNPQPSGDRRRAGRAKAASCCSRRTRAIAGRITASSGCCSTRSCTSTIMRQSEKAGTTSSTTSMDADRRTWMRRARIRISTRALEHHREAGAFALKARS